ncbi:phage virion morphogenesis protein [Volucribacter amazonae]|uniref:Virion morphogenesis protein n=1 Tax=Volucribacter amazonae TaxID=256731 RepID=A0A9X4SHW4_9PAST|nr:phage virion morphogenesis protein [Volucribacter amazonae]MDG6895047.1 virion morphogenesis protein [Volucribacter amazonae]
MIELEVNNDERIAKQLGKAIQGLTNRSPLMQKLAGTMLSVVQQNFVESGRPKWAGLAYREGKPLIDSGNLQNSIQAKHNHDEAIVGTNVLYAALHHFGGTIKPKKVNYLKFKIGERFVQVKSVTIPARPFLTLTEQDKADLVADMQDYFRSLLSQ